MLPKENKTDMINWVYWKHSVFTCLQNLKNPIVYSWCDKQHVHVHQLRLQTKFFKSSITKTSDIFTEYIFLEFQSLSLLHRLNIHSKARENCRWQMLKERNFIYKQKKRRTIHLHNNLLLRENKHNSNRFETWLNLTTIRMNRSVRWIINERSISVQKEPYNNVNEDKSKRTNDSSQ